MEAPPPDGCRETLAPDAWSGEAARGLVELWRAGGTNEGEELSLPIAAAVAPDGRLAIPDFELGLIGVGPDGDWLGSLVRRGEGPGEAELPLAAAWTPEGHLAVLDFGDASVLELALPPGGSRSAGGAKLVSERRLDRRPIAAMMAGGQVAGVALSPGGFALLQDNVEDVEAASVTQTLVRLPADGSEADTLTSVTTAGLGGEWRPARTLPAPGAPRLLFAAGPDGRIAVAGGTPEYEIHVLGPGGDSTVVCRPATGLPLRPDETGEDPGDREADDPLLAALRGADAVEPPAPIGRLLFGREGRLWVERDRASLLDPLELQYGHAGSLYDVFDAEGRYLGEVRAPEDARLVATSGDRVWAFETGGFDVTWVVAYRLERPGR